MSSLKYIWRNASRNRLRTALTVLSIGFSFAFMTVIYGYMVTQSTWSDGAKKYNRIVVMNIQGFSGKAPISYVDKIREMDGVVDVVPFAWYGGDYKEEKMPFAQFGTDADHAFNVWPEFKIDEAELKAWQADQQGCVVDRRLAEKRNWKIGDKVPLKGTYYPYNLELTVDGFFDPPMYSGQLWFHWKYLDEGLRSMKARGDGNSGTIFAKIKDAAEIPAVVQAIDKKFASSENPTRTQTESAFAQMFADMMGNLQLLLLVIAAAVVFSLTLVAATGMAMATRERTTEIAVLKAIGFPRGRVLGLVLGESCLISFFGGILGIALGCVFLHFMHVLNEQMFPFTPQDLAGLWLLVLLGVACGIGVISGVVPAVLASRISVIDGLRRVI